MEFDSQIKVYNLRTVFKHLVVIQEKSTMGPHRHEIALEYSNKGSILTLICISLEMQEIQKACGFWEKQKQNNCDHINTSYLTDSYIVFTLKMESVSKITIFGLHNCEKWPRKEQSYPLIKKWTLFFYSYLLTKREKSGGPKCLQNYDKEVDMGKHTFILTINIYS